VGFDFFDRGFRGGFGGGLYCAIAPRDSSNFSLSSSQPRARAVSMNRDNWSDMPLGEFLEAVIWASRQNPTNPVPAFPALNVAAF
jgi:hypothetical protein